MSEEVDAILSGGVKSFSFDRIGDEITGVIARSEVRQQRDFETGDPVTWNDGTAKMQIIVDLETDIRDPQVPFDDGMRRLYIKGNGITALRQAVKASQSPGLLDGGKLSMKFAAEGTAPRKGMNAPKLFEAKYEPPAPRGVDVENLA